MAKFIPIKIYGIHWHRLTISFEFSIAATQYSTFHRFLDASRPDEKFATPQAHVSTTGMATAVRENSTDFVSARCGLLDSRRGNYRSSISPIRLCLGGRMTNSLDWIGG